MEPIKPLDELEMRMDFKRMYQEIGKEAAMQVLYEMLFSANILCEVMIEEAKKNESH